MTILWGVLAALGAVGFVWGLSVNPKETWSLYLANLMFWSAIAATGPAIAAMMQLTEARWSPTVRRLALTTAGFLPVAFVLLVVLFFGRADLYGWVTTPIPVKAAWLNVPFFFGRTLVLSGLLFLIAYVFIGRLLRDPVPQDEAPERARRNRLATILLFVWIITLSLWGFDLLMSLDPKWYSGLFGGYYVVTALYTSFATLSILSVMTNSRGIPIPPAAIQDVAKLQFAMSIMWMYFFWSQYLVIWYGNVPIETRFFARRFFVQPWQTLAWVIFFIGWLFPFAYLLKRLTGRPPQRHTPLVVVAVLGLTGIFLERILVVFPTVSAANRLPLGLRDLLITAGFLGAVHPEPAVVHGTLQARSQPASHRRPLASAPEAHGSRGCRGPAAPPGALNPDSVWRGPTPTYFHLTREHVPNPVRGTVHPPPGAPPARDTRESRAPPARPLTGLTGRGRRRTGLERHFETESV